MKKKYTERDFKTYFAAEIFRGWQETTDFGLLQEYGQHGIKDEIIDGLQKLIPDFDKKIAELYAVEDDNTSTHAEEPLDTSLMSLDASTDLYSADFRNIVGIPEGVTSIALSDGREISIESAVQFGAANARKYVLDVLHTFEHVLRENKTPQDVLGLFQGQRKHRFADHFTKALPAFPAEATFIRTELRNPEARKDNALYDFMMQNTADNLNAPVMYTPGSGMPTQAPIGSHGGPRLPGLDPMGINKLLNFWAGSDQALDPIITAVTAGADLDSFKNDMH